MLAKKKKAIFGLPLERRKIDESPATIEDGAIEGFRRPSYLDPEQRSISGTISGTAPHARRFLGRSKEPTIGELSGMPCRNHVVGMTASRSQIRKGFEPGFARRRD